jgi:hypothetical protein
VEIYKGLGFGCMSCCLQLLQQDQDEEMLVPDQDVVVEGPQPMEGEISLCFYIFPLNLI